MASVAFERVTKRFPGVHALDAVSFEIATGHCHALVGENGAGKSTIGKILAGVYTADDGRILHDGRPVHPKDPLEARRLGVAMVHQELAFCPNLSVAENLCLGDFPARAGWVDRGAVKARAQELLAEIGCDLDVGQPMSCLSTGQEQLVQIASALGTNARVVIMDEPTSSLSAGESEHLFTLLAELKRRGITVIYVSHRMEEIFRLCDSLTVLRDGRHVATGPVSATNPGEVVRQMVGRELAAETHRHMDQTLGEPLLRVENLSSPGKFENIHFELRAGEILGMAGLIGAGRSEVAQAIFGLDPEATGRVWVAGEELELGSVRESLDAGIGLLPEDRKRQGLVLGMNCRENSSLAALDRFSTAGFVNRSQERRAVETYSNRLRVKTPSLEAAVAGLSGGNQQKLALAKWLMRECRILMVDEPTRGVDVGAKAEIHRLLDELACQGMGILLISSELPEVMSLSRRLLVLREGVQLTTLERADFSQETLMRWMAGLAQETA